MLLEYCFLVETVNISYVSFNKSRVQSFNPLPLPSSTLPQEPSTKLGQTTAAAPTLCTSVPMNIWTCFDLIPFKILLKKVTTQYYSKKLITLMLFNYLIHSFIVFVFFYIYFLFMSLSFFINICFCCTAFLRIQVFKQLNIFIELLNTLVF